MDIATGAVEGAINYIIGSGSDGSMLRWSPARADHAHAARGSPVIGRITPQHRQTPYDAVRKAA